ncbi:reverse transcriptase domain-containing protein [Tanacetum coccineum]
MAPGGLQFLAIAVEHSTMWVEAKPLTTINGRQVEKFIWEYVVCRFGVPRIISSKEEKHFKEGMFANLCKGLKVTQSFSPITEHMEIMHHIERQLTQSQQVWVDNPAKTLWIHRTLPRNSQKETPFSLTYGLEAVIPIIKTTYDNGRVQKATKGKESKEVASIEKAYYQNKLRNTITQGAVTPGSGGGVGSSSGVSEVKEEFMGGIGGGSFAIRSMVAKDGLRGNGLDFDCGRSPSTSSRDGEDGGLANKSSMGSRLIVTGEVSLDGWVGAGGSEVNGEGVILGISKQCVVRWWREWLIGRRCGSWIAKATWPNTHSCCSF